MFKNVIFAISLVALLPGASAAMLDMPWQSAPVDADPNEGLSGCWVTTRLAFGGVMPLVGQVDEAVRDAVGPQEMECVEDQVETCLAYMLYQTQQTRTAWETTAHATSSTLRCAGILAGAGSGSWAQPRLFADEDHLRVMVFERTGTTHGTAVGATVYFDGYTVRGVAVHHGSGIMGCTYSAGVDGIGRDCVY